MARFPLATRLLLPLGVVIFLAYLLVLDLGISAGRIHHGVSVEDLDLGGLTKTEAAVRLQQRARQLENAPVELTGYGLDRSLLPTEVGWRPRPGRTAATAMRVGREHAPFIAMWDRLRAWFGGVEIEWKGRPDPQLMSTYVKGVNRDALESGVRVDRVALRRAIRFAITTWPREPVRIPLKKG